MENSKRKLSAGLKRLITATIIVAIIYIGSFFLYAFLVAKVNDPDLNSFANVMSYHGKGMLALFLFNYAGGSNIGYYAFSAFLYALIVCWLIFLVAGIAINNRKARKVMWWGIVLAFFSLVVYLVFASGSKKFWAIANQREPFDNNLPLTCIGALYSTLGSLYIFLTLLVYFWCVIDSFLHPGNKPELVEEPISNAKNERVDIRAIVRDEINRNQPFQVCIVGGELQMVKEEKEEPVPAPAPLPEPEPEPEPEPLPEPIPEPVVMEEPKEEEIIDIPLRVEEPEEEMMPLEEQPEDGDMFDSLNKKQRESFLERILKAELETKANYNEIKNEALAYGIKARLSRTGEIFRLHKKKYMKIFLVGKTLKVYLALSPEDYKDSTFPIEDVGHRPAYAEIPLLFKVRSGLSVRRCKELIKAAAEKDGLEKKEFEGVNWVSELRTLNAEKAKESKNK